MIRMEWILDQGMLTELAALLLLTCSLKIMKQTLEKSQHPAIFQL